jgi:hypothetical protein
MAKKPATHKEPARIRSAPLRTMEQAVQDHLADRGFKVSRLGDAEIVAVSNGAFDLVVRFYATRKEG